MSLWCTDFMEAYCLSGLVSGTTFSQNFWEVREILRASWFRFQDLVYWSQHEEKERVVVLWCLIFFIYPCSFVGTNTSAEIFGLDTHGFEKPINLYSNQISPNNCSSSLGAQEPKLYYATWLIIERSLKTQINLHWISSVLSLMCQRAVVAIIATSPVLGPKILEYPMQNLLIHPHGSLVLFWGHLMYHWMAECSSFYFFWIMRYEILAPVLLSLF